MRTIIFLFLIITVFWNCSNDDAVLETKDDGQPKYTSALNWMGHWKARLGKEQMVYAVTREFELLNQDIKVTSQFPQEIFKSEGYAPLLVDSVVKMIKANKYSWDIVFIDVSNYENISRKLNDFDWGKKYLVNFEEFDWFKASHKPFIFEDPYYKMSTGGQIIGPVIEGIYVALWYNKKVADKIGLTIKQENMTFDDFKGYVQTAFEYNKTAGQKITLINKETQNNIYILFANLVLSGIGEIDSVQTDMVKSKAALLKALKAFEELSAYKPLEIVHEKGTKETTLLDEKNLFTIIHTYSYNRWARMDPVKTANLIPVELPSLGGKPPYYPGTYQSVWAVFKNAPNKDNAIKAMKYLCSNDIAQQWLTMTKNPTGLRSRITSTDLAQDDVNRFITHIDRKYGKTVKNVNLARVLFGEKNSGVPINAEPVLKGEISADEYYSRVIKQLK